MGRGAYYQDMKESLPGSGQAIVYHDSDNISVEKGGLKEYDLSSWRPPLSEPVVWCGSTS